ncbi:MAG: ABC transporter ATP-binding protein [Ignavibacteria bacterium]|nr:ABC transporter ATP-binding protein [Ignavibacteria bacterium]
MITVENLVKVYSENVKALNGISFNVEPGEVCGYLGANGAGKSTTIKIMCGMLQPTSGSVIVNDFSIESNPESVKRMIGYVPESGALFLSLSPFDFLEFVCRMYDIDKNTYIQRIFSFMELFDLKDEINTPMHAFSKGMRQKVLLISSLIHNPDIIIWDEPLNSLDYDTTLLVRDIVKDLSAKGCTFFYSTHQVESAVKLCSRVIILNKGNIAYQGAVDVNNPSSLEELMKTHGSSADTAGKLEGLFKNFSG